MATALMAWFSAPAPTTWTSTTPAWRTTPAMAPATELGLDLLDTLRISTAGPQRPARDAFASRADHFDTRSLDSSRSPLRSVQDRETGCVTGPVEPQSLS